MLRAHRMHHLRILLAFRGLDEQSRWGISRVERLMYTRVSG